MYRKLAAFVVILTFASVSAAEARHQKGHQDGNNGGPIAFVISCDGPKGPFTFKAKTAQDGIQQCLAGGGHPLGVAPLFR